MSSLSLHLTYRANPNVLINDNFRTFSGETGFFCHTIGKNKIILQLSTVLTYTYILLTFFFFLLAQPYMLSSIQLFLWSGNRRKYRYFIETSVDKSNWKIAADRRNEDCTSWQVLKFDQRPVVYISITGTHSTVIIDNEFCFLYLECGNEP
jgi:BTB/POZ domain-containing protein 9